MSVAESGASPPSAAACAEGREVRDLRSEESWRGGVERESESGRESARVLVRERERIEVRGPRSEEEERVCLGVSLSV